MRYFLLFLLIFVAPLHAEETEVHIDAAAIAKVASVLNNLSIATSDLGEALELGNEEGARRIAGRIHGRIGDLVIALKEIAPPDLHRGIHEITHELRKNLKEMERKLTREQMELARLQYLRFRENQSNLDLYFQDILKDKAEVRGWLRWLIDWMLDIFYTE